MGPRIPQGPSWRPLVDRASETQLIPHETIPLPAFRPAFVEYRLRSGPRIDAPLSRGNAGDLSHQRRVPGGDLCRRARRDRSGGAGFRRTGTGLGGRNAGLSLPAPGGGTGPEPGPRPGRPGRGRPSGPLHRLRRGAAQREERPAVEGRRAGELGAAHPLSAGHRRRLEGG